MYSRCCRSFVSAVLFLTVEVAAADSQPPIEAKAPAKAVPPFLKSPALAGPTTVPAVLPQSPSPPSADSIAPPRRQSSVAISKAIRAGLPNFNPPKPTAPTAADDDVVLLPEVNVSEDKIRVPSESEVSTKSLGEEVLPNFYAEYTGLIGRDARRLANMKELGELAEDLKMAGRHSDSADLKRDIQKTFIRRPNWKDEAMDKLYNRGHR